MNTTFLDAMATQADVLITHIALFGDGSEVTGGSPAYARKAVTWTAPAGDGLIRPNANLVFDIPAAGKVDEWRGFSASSGGTDYGGAVLTEETFAGQGTYTLLAASTGIDFDAV
jgi:hypothetical protein